MTRFPNRKTVGLSLMGAGVGSALVINWLLVIALGLLVIGYVITSRGELGGSNILRKVDLLIVKMSKGIPDWFFVVLLVVCVICVYPFVVLGLALLMSISLPEWMRGAFFVSRFLLFLSLCLAWLGYELERFARKHARVVEVCHSRRAHAVVSLRGSSPSAELMEVSSDPRKYYLN